MAQGERRSLAGDVERAVVGDLAAGHLGRPRGRASGEAAIEKHGCHGLHGGGNAAEPFLSVKSVV